MQGSTAQARLRPVVLMLVAAACLAAGQGCRSCLGFGPAVRVAPFPASSTAALRPEQTVELMRYAGFSPAEVEATGLALRNALAGQGGARIMDDHHAAAILVVHDRVVHVASWRTGSFVYDLEGGPAP